MGSAEVHRLAAFATLSRMTAPVTPPRYPFSAVVVFGGGAIALAALGWSLFSVVRTHAEGLLDVSAEADSAPTGPPPNAVLFDSVASATDADMHDGVWFLLDKRISRVHRLIDDNSQWSAFGRPGDGPGELRRPAALAVHGDTVVVATPSRLQLYWPDGSYIGGREVEPPRICRHAQLGEMAARLYDVASSPEGLLLLFTCTTGRARGGVFLEIGEASYRPVVQGPTDASDYLWDPWHDMSVLATHPRGLVFGHPEDDCLGVFGLEGARLDSSCHARLDRVPVSTATALAEQVRAEFEGASAQIRIPQRYPPFDRVGTAR